MTVATIKRWPTTEKTPLPELFGISDDLMSAWLLFQNAEAVSALISRPLNQYEVLDALISSAIIKYLRSFGTGIRMKLLIDDIRGISEEMFSHHHRLKAFRDRHIAHPVSGFETESVFVSVHNDGTDSARIMGVSSGGQRSRILNSAEIAQSLSLCQTVMEHVRQLMAAETGRLFEIAKHMPIGEINSLPCGPVEPNSDPTSRR